MMLNLGISWLPNPLALQYTNETMKHLKVKVGTAYLPRCWSETMLPSLLTSPVSFSDWTEYVGVVE